MRPALGNRLAPLLGRHAGRVRRERSGEIGPRKDAYAGPRVVAGLLVAIEDEALGVSPGVEPVGDPRVFVCDHDPIAPIAARRGLVAVQAAGAVHVVTGDPGFRVASERPKLIRSLIIGIPLLTEFPPQVREGVKGGAAAFRNRAINADNVSATIARGFFGVLSQRFLEDPKFDTKRSAFQATWETRLSSRFCPEQMGLILEQLSSFKPAVDYANIQQPVCIVATDTGMGKHSADLLYNLLPNRTSIRYMHDGAQLLTPEFEEDIAQLCLEFFKDPWGLVRPRV